MQRNLKIAGGGMLLLLAIILAVFVGILPEARSVIMAVGAIIIFLAWFGYSLEGIFFPRNRTIQIIATIGLAVWVALLTTVWLRSDVLVRILPVANILGGIAVFTLILIPSIELITERKIRIGFKKPQSQKSQ